jgi:hypothetical protein
VAIGRRDQNVTVQVPTIEIERPSEVNQAASNASN